MVRNDIKKEMRIGYNVKVSVEITESDAFEFGNLVKKEEGCFEMNISEEDGISIDKCEKALLRTNHAAIRDAISKHLTEVSKKKP
ncbi:MAG: hypothetical protein WC623_23960 [Pedobacter sp.]|uniref:hypothetical protein n=1 Tax=Pedobacter sp. TaxID=1411316 RepID=UPI0035658D37